jgi:HK97 gp10 family phage protein
MRISGTEQLTRALQALANGDFDGAVEDGAEVALYEVQKATPVDTGELRDSEHIEKPAENQRDVVADAPHAIPVELGTSRMAARPFMRNAFYSKYTKILQAINYGVMERIRRMVS